MTKITTKDASVQTLLGSLILERTAFRNRAAETTSHHISKLRERLVGVGWDLATLAPRPSASNSRKAYMQQMKLREDVKHWFESDAAAMAGLSCTERNRIGHPELMKDRELIEERIAARAEKITAEYFDGWVLKLAGKIGKPVASATVSGDIWESSRLMIRAQDGEEQVWTTRCIFNISVLGKIFNQWPTRRES